MHSQLMYQIEGSLIKDIFLPVEWFQYSLVYVQTLLCLQARELFVLAFELTSLLEMGRGVLLRTRGPWQQAESRTGGKHGPGAGPQGQVLHWMVPH
jgi:hypothetical protein